MSEEPPLGAVSAGPVRGRQAGANRPSAADRVVGASPVSGRQAGAITAEFAVALPAVVLLLAFLLAGGAAGLTQLRLEEAARAGARALARGESTTTVTGIVQRSAGEGTAVGIASDGGWVRVDASARVGGALGILIPWTLSAEADALQESSGTEVPADG
ncbi:TadE family type IV pilus minor pilin [Paenarthrobacter sp. NPDC018779]|uniref:TadE family type IV pilus minor pilin n=1 Tax=Paenarthrobacter sp. NPDC018779 TaxID=3364375 RepID=UPI0037CC7474